MSSILIIGSYNGQDSLGDKCILFSVISQIKSILGNDTKIIIHSTLLEDPLKNERVKRSNILWELGFLYFSNLWHTKLRHLYLPKILHRLVSISSLPLYLIANQKNRQELKRICLQIQESQFVYFYGGSSFSEQFFWGNFIPFLLTAFFCRLYNTPLYLGPQQYGQMTKLQRSFLLPIFKYLVKDIRTRNENCLELLNLSSEKLCYDEVYSCKQLYPNLRSHLPNPTFILVNIRQTNFLKDFDMNEFELFLNLLHNIQKQLNLPFKLFQMSGLGFSDDTKILQFLQKSNFDKINIDVLSPFVDEEELINIANQAYGTISMSYHGCIFSMIGGCPSVAITSGDYYDYKYIGFDSYSGGQGLPIIDLNNLNIEKATSQICDYFAKYSAERTANTREEAAQIIEKWYRQIADDTKEKFSE